MSILQLAPKTFDLFDDIILLSEGQILQNELVIPFDKNQSHKAALVFKKYLVPKIELLKANFDKEWLLIERNSFVYVFKTVQIMIVAIITSTVFSRTELRSRNEDDGIVYIGTLLFGMIYKKKMVVDDEGETTMPRRGTEDDGGARDSRKVRRGR
ncbi:ABC-2 transporter [Forsythia ovata]|uniref:ABC-2 transporter n=1 Tax=Forsythia ovata TaxID=205694 RepID=A0ABD1RIU6_9LAMI